MWDKWESALPPDGEIRRFLERDKEFNPKHVGRVVSNYRATLEFAKLIGKDAEEEPEKGSPSSDTSNNVNGPETPPKEVQAGSYVQWTSQGVDQFPQPQKVLGVSGDYAFVEGSQTGLPMSELTITESPVEQTPPSPPPQNPFYKSPSAEDREQESGTVVVQYKLDEGSVRLEWPDELSKDSVEEFEYWVKGLIKRAERKAGLPKGGASGDPTPDGILS